MPGNPTDYARALYATLRDADTGGYDLLILETPPDLPAWQAVLNRLRRAAHR
jgi:L-threonylcarbamoyladenylate synthase